MKLPSRWQHKAQGGANEVGATRDQIDEDDPKPAKRVTEVPNAVARFTAWMLIFLL